MKIMTDEWIRKISNNDNQIGNISRKDDEYVVQINLWNGEVCNLKTIGCKSIYHRIDLVDEIGDIVREDSIYRFMTVATDGETETILEIETDGLMEIE